MAQRRKQDIDNCGYQVPMVSNAGAEYSTLESSTPAKGTPPSTNVPKLPPIRQPEPVKRRLSGCCVIVTVIVVLVLLFAAVIVTWRVTMHFAQLEGPCPPSYTRNANICYRLSTDRKPFQEALSVCVLEGSDLVTVESKTEDDFLKQIIGANPYCGESILYWWDDGAWIGLTDVFNSSDWRWISNGKSPTYTNWVEGEPSASSHDNVTSEHCAQKTRDHGDQGNGRWNSLTCSSRLCFVCEQNIV